MADNKRYFQLTPDILVEYIYSEEKEINKEINVADSLIIIDNKYNDTKYITFNNKNGVFGDRDASGVSNYNLTNFVTPKNNIETIYTSNVSLDSKIKCNEFNGIDGDIDNKMIFNKVKINFTGGDIFGSYASLVFNFGALLPNGHAFSLASFVFKRTDDVNILPTPLLINQKLYTTFIDVDILSVSNLLKSSRGVDKEFLKNISSNGALLKNSPVTLSLSGVKYISDSGIYNCDKIVSIKIPSSDTYSSVSVDIKESTEGDFFVIKPTVTSSNKMSFSDYISNLSNGNTESIIVMYEIKLIENYVDSSNNPKSIETHSEYHIVNTDFNNEMLDEMLDGAINYRPILMSTNVFSIDIAGNLKIINTFDNTTIVKPFSGNFNNISKYGKTIERIEVKSGMAQVNVYNKRTDDELDSIKIANSKGGAVIENHQHSIIGFIECINVGATIESVPAGTIEML